MDSELLIDELTQLCENHKKEVEFFQRMTINDLNDKRSTDSWSILECIEHLNRYGNFYIPEIKRQMEKSRHAPSKNFKSGVLGNYFSKSMLPKEKLNKMKTFSSMNPLNSALNKEVLEVFKQQLEDLISLLQTARNKDLTKIKTSISISKWIKLRLGDTFRVVIYHNLRHIEQANKVLLER